MNLLLKSFLYNGTSDENLPAPLAFSQRIVKKMGSKTANLFFDVLAKLTALRMEHFVGFGKTTIMPERLTLIYPLHLIQL